MIAQQEDENEEEIKQLRTEYDSRVESLNSENIRLKRENENI